ANVIRLDEDWRLIESLLPEGWMDKARQLRAFRRARGIADARALLRVMLIHLAQGCGLRVTATEASLAGIAQVSDVALLKRLRSCGAWFEWMAQQLRLSPQLATPLPATQGILGHHRLRVVDGSVVSEPGVTGSQWRLHYSITLPQLHCEEVHVGPRDDDETLKRFQVQSGDIFVADRGYAHPAGIAHVRHGGGEVIVRMNLVTLPLQAPDTGEPLDILPCVRNLEVGQADHWPAQVAIKAKRGEKTQQIIQGRLCAVRKSAAAAAKACERVRRESARNGTQLQPQTLEAADYVLIFTTLPDEMTAADVMEIYRLRWQIELEFKRLKSLLQLGHLKKHDECAARSWLQGKLLVALLIARLIAHAERFSPWGYDIAGVAAAQRCLSMA
ncbi:MAG: IS4 family transposase, partial [Rhodanobacter sp.]|nr:IS4 family transposase [Rhodanobacter sp.]